VQFALYPSAFCTGRGDPQANKNTSAIDLTLAIRAARNLPRGCGSLASNRISWIWGAARLRVANITEGAIRQARQKLADAEQENERASAALMEALTTAKAMIDEANKRTQDQDTGMAALLTKLLTEEEVKKVRQNAADYAKQLLADFDAARVEMNARFVKAIAADENAS